MSPRSPSRLRPLRLRRLAALAFGLLSLRASALLVFEAPLDKAAWAGETDDGYCRLAQTIPGLGRAVFEARARDEQFFYLDRVRRPLPQGSGLLVAAAPFWDPGRESRTLSTVSLADGERPLVLTPVVAQRMLDSLAEGLAPTIVRTGSNGFESLRVTLLPVAFGHAYSGWRACQSGLKQATRKVVAPAALLSPVVAGGSRAGVLSVPFASHQAQLDADARARLDALAARLREDGTLRLRIDGHADESRRQLLNLELSRKRADVARDYLVRAGVDRRRIECHYHGERQARAGTNNKRIDLRIEPTAGA